MPLIAPAAPAEGGLLSNFAPLLVIAALALIVLSHQGVNAWVRAIGDRMREHFYGPVDPYLPPPPANAPDAAPGDAPSGAHDEFDYSIYDIYTRESQQTGRPPADPHEPG